MPLVQRNNKVSNPTGDALIADTNVLIESGNVQAALTNQATGDMGFQRVRMNRGDTDLDGYTFGSIIMDGTSTNTKQTGGMPSSSVQNRAFYPATNGTGHTFYITSTSTSDAVAGGGAEKVYLEGLGGDWEPKIEELTLTGQTSVATATSTWLRINKMFVSQVATNEDSNVGDIYVSTVDDAVLGVPQSNVVCAMKALYSYSTFGSYTSGNNQNVYFVRGSYYTDASPESPLINEEYSVYPWGGSAAPDTNRIRLLVGKLYSSTTAAFNTSGASPEIGNTDMEFTIQSGKTNQPVNYSIYWNTLRVVDASF